MSAAMPASGPPVHRFAVLAAEILARPARPAVTRLVAIDGPGGSGKSTFAARLAAALGGAQVIHTDDFVDGWEDSTGYWTRMYAQVLAPLLAGRPGRYQRHDWELGRLTEWHDVPVAPVVVVEGVGSARRDIADDLTMAVWVSTPAALRLERGLLRDGADRLPDWQLWMADEDRHFAEDRTWERADLVVDGNPTVAHDPETEFVLQADHPGRSRS